MPETRAILVCARPKFGQREDVPSESQAPAALPPILQTQQALAAQRVEDLKTEAMRELERTIERLEKAKRDIEAGNLEFYADGIDTYGLNTRLIKAASAKAWGAELANVPTYIEMSKRT